MSYDVNPYQSFGATPVAYERSALSRFLAGTYTNLAGGVAAFVALEVVLFQTGLVQRYLQFLMARGGMMAMLILIGAFMVISVAAQKMATSLTSRPLQYAGFGLYIALEAVIFAPLLYLATQMEQVRGVEILGPAAMITLVLFGGLTAVVLYTRHDFSWMRSILWFGSLAAFVAVLAGLVFGFSLGIFFCVAMVILFCGWILYDTSNIIHHYQEGMEVAAALALFASLATLFWYVLRLVMAFQQRD